MLQLVDKMIRYPVSRNWSSPLLDAGEALSEAAAVSWGVVFDGFNCCTLQSKLIYIDMCTTAVSYTSHIHENLIYVKVIIRNIGNKKY